MLNQALNVESTRSTSKSFYGFAGVAAVIVALLTLAEVVALALYPQPSTISGWFSLFQSNWIVGFVDFWALELPMYAMFVFVFLALYFALRKVDEALMSLALALALLGIGIFLATNNPFAMLSLSNQYAAATTDAERSTFLAAGQAILTNTNQRAIGGFNTGLFLVSVAGLVVAVVMLPSASFSRPTAYLGIVAFGLSLADYLRQALTPSPVIALLVILPNVLFLVIWFALVGRRLWQLGRLSR